MLRQVVAQQRAWIDAGLKVVTVAINLSAVQFRHPALSQLVATVLHEQDLAPRLIELELTERVMMHEPRRALEIVNELHGLGVPMSIDDFGTGYSSLSQLKQLKVSKLKIDKTFIRDINTDHDDRAIVTAIIKLAKSMAIQTIAEGVESEDQLEFLRRQGCDEFQGYLESPAVPAPEFASTFLSKAD